MHSLFFKMAHQNTIAEVAKIATKKSYSLSTGYKPLHIVTRQNAFVTELNSLLRQYPPHTYVGDIELSYSVSAPHAKKVACADN